MWRSTKTRSLCTSAICLVTIILVCAGMAWSAPDAVQDLQQALVVRPNDRSRMHKEFLSHRDRILQERVKALGTISDLRRALVEWKFDPDRFGVVQKLDEKWRAVVGKRLLAALSAAAKSPEANVRLAVAALIADMGSDVPAVEAAAASGFSRSLTGIVIQLSRDPAPPVREEALRALGTINADPARAVSVLGEALKSAKEVSMRRVAADGLWRMVQVVTGLNKNLQTRSAEVWATDEELIKTCTDVVEKIAAVSNGNTGIRDPDAEVRLTCLEAVRAAGLAFGDLPGAYKEDEFPPADRKLAEDELTDIRKKYERVQNEINSLQPLLQAMAGHAVLLREAAADPAPQVKLAAAATLEEFSHLRLRLRQRAESLPKLDAVPKPVVNKDFDKAVTGNWPVMAALLQDPANELEVRRRAMEFLENLGDDAIPALAAITKALGDHNRFIRWAAVRTLGNLPMEKAATAVTDIAALLDDNDNDVRQAVARTLERLGPRAKAALEPLKARILDKKRDPEFRAAVMYAIAGIGPEDTQSAIPQLIRALTDSETRVRQAAAEVLGKYGVLAKSAVPAVRETLDDEDVDVRRRASDALLNILLGAVKE